MRSRRSINARVSAPGSAVVAVPLGVEFPSARDHFNFRYLPLLLRFFIVDTLISVQQAQSRPPGVPYGMPPGPPLSGVPPAQYQQLMSYLVCFVRLPPFSPH